ncbi:LLM class flavin-dependent oxidoreductase [Amycolatopsis sp. NPDC059090]|uniref:LLM class flavin-dependent oxidoreductase n=1 Tax=unclassified Amycolatopsis TaxID=2618356 RepID=UPI003672AFD8
MRFSFCIPNFGDFADPRTVAKVASAAEEAGWDGLFVWDHVVLDKRPGRLFGDPWILLTAAALATSRIRLGPMVTPVARRRPQQLARVVSTLDNLSGGRVVFGVGLGAPLEAEFGDFGESADPKTVAEKLDEGVDLIARLWTGDPVTFSGKHFTARDIALLPTPVQRPRPPVWVAGRWPNRRPMRRAARWDGVVPIFESAGATGLPEVAEVRDMIAYIRSERDTDAPFDVVLGGTSPADPAQARSVVEPFAEAGVTWWEESLPFGSPEEDKLDPVLRRVEAGPPAL